MIGDKKSDIEFGRVSNLNTILFSRDSANQKYSNIGYISNSFLDMKKIILKNEI